MCIFINSQQLSQQLLYFLGSKSVQHMVRYVQLRAGWRPGSSEEQRVALQWCDAHFSGILTSVRDE